MKLFFIVAVLLAFSKNTLAGESRDWEKTNRRIAERYFNEVWNQGKLEVLDEILDPDYFNATPSTPNPPRGPAGLKPIVSAIRKGFPDLHYEIKDLVISKNAVAIRVVMTGTQTGELFGAPPTGKKVRVNQIQIETIRDGKITEHWRVTDELSMMNQLSGKSLHR